MAIKRNEEIKKQVSLNDRVAERITEIAGSTSFLVINVLMFIFWILLNTGYFGEKFIIDPFPFSFLTTAVSLEAIILSTFVLMSQRRQSKVSEIRTELDYKTDLESEVDIKAIIGILERIAQKQDIEISDLLRDMKDKEKKSAE